MNDFEKNNEYIGCGTDLENAKEQLKKGSTCAFCREGEIYTAKGRGIKPLLELVEGKTSFKGFSAADTIVGKAAAMLFALAGVRSVYGEVMSKRGKTFLEERGISCSYGVLSPKIINRKGDGECPMELVVKGLIEPEEAMEKIKEKLAELMMNKQVSTE